MIASTGANASPMFYTVFGALFAVLGALLAFDYRGFGTKYIELGLGIVDRNRRLSEKNRQRYISFYRFGYGVVSALGCLMFLSGILSH